jgi:hypothetical protein
LSFFVIVTHSWFLRGLAPPHVLAVACLTTAGPGPLIGGVGRLAPVNRRIDRRGAAYFSRSQ